MYTNLRLRSQASLDDLCDAFDDITWERVYLNAMAHRALTTPDLQTYHSTASAPSLRSREPIDVMERPFTPDVEGGHVKVVVRVRKFIKRGELHMSSGIARD